MGNKYFLGSVGTVEAFRRNKNGDLELAFRSKTLTDSGINISTTKDDIRAGTGAPIQFSFYHDPSVEINLTDVIFDEKYIEAQLGADFKQGGDAYQSETKKASGSKITLDKVPVALSAGCNSAEVVVWLTEKGKDNWRRVDAANVTALSKEVTGLVDNTEYCVRYLADDSDVRVAQITSEILPQELFLIITAPVFSGDSCSASNGKKAGDITYEIPRFKLNGAQDFAMNMSSNQPMSLAGSALASEDGCEMTSSGLLRIIVRYNDQRWYTNLKDLIPDEDFLKVGDAPHIYALLKDGDLFLVKNEDLVFSPALADGEWSAAGETTITVKVPQGETSPITETAVVTQA